METRREESDQLPEEGPAGQVPEDTDEEVREDAEENAGARGGEGQASGHPENAG